MNEVFICNLSENALREALSGSLQSLANVLSLQYINISHNLHSFGIALVMNSGN